MLAGGDDNPLQYSCPENAMDRGAWRAAAPKVTKQLAMTVVTHTQAHTYVRGALEGLRVTSVSCESLRQLNN